MLKEHLVLFGSVVNMIIVFCLLNIGVVYSNVFIVHHNAALYHIITGALMLQSVLLCRIVLNFVTLHYTAA